MRHVGETFTLDTLENGKVRNMESNAPSDQLIIDLEAKTGIQSSNPEQIQVISFKNGFTIKGNITGKMIKVYSNN